MIRFIAALDNQNGIADDHGIPWMGKIPGDIAHYRQTIKGFPVIMGYGHYIELKKPYPESVNYVATSRDDLLAGFIAVPDAHTFLERFTEDIWNIGGGQLYASTIDLADELILTRIHADFNCTKFFPTFEESFRLQSRGDVMTENGLDYHFETWKRLT